MKRIFLLAAVLLVSIKGVAQNDDFKKNQVNLNILNAIWLTSVEIGYERYVAPNQSVEGQIFFNDRFSVFPKRNGEKYNATSFSVGYNYYFDEDGGTGFYINPFMKVRSGSYKDKDGAKTKLDSFILGIGGGYIWNYDDTFIIAPYANIGRNFGKEVNDNKKFWAVEPNFGIKIGYKF